MHALFMTRGIKRDVDELIKFLETRAFALPFVREDGSEGNKIIQGNLQPIQLWSYVYPQVAMDGVLNSLKFDKENIKRWQNPKMKAMVFALRKAMGGEPIPEFDKSKHIHLPLDAMQNISIIPIGVKYDAVMKHNDGTIHEAL